MIGRLSHVFLPIMTGLFLAGSLLASNAKANYEVNLSEFSFPSCTSLLSNPGDHASYDSGTHQIVGGPLLEGSDDVYAQDSGNFTQCYCPVTGSEGIQTNWLRSEEPIDGWFFEFGEQWNLGPFHYAAQNSNFSCGSQPENPPTGGGEPSNPGSGGAEAPRCPVDNKPQIVDQVWFSDIKPTSLTVHWAIKGDATAYQLAYGIEDNKWLWGVKVEGGNVNSYELKDLPKDVKIYVSVIPQNGNCGGDPSAVTTLAATGNSSSMAMFLGGFSLITLGLWQSQKALKKN